MTLEQIYYVGQTIAVLAILISLVAVFFQMRRQSQIARSELYLTATAGFADAFRAFRSDPDFARLYSASLQDWASLSRAQKLQIHSFNVEMVLNLDSILTMHAQNLIDENQTKPWTDNMLGVITTSGGAQWWQEAAFLFTPQLCGALDHRLKDPNSLPPPWTEFQPWLSEQSDIDMVTGGKNTS